MSTAQPNWTPNEDTISSSNLTSAFEDAGLADYDAFHRWSVDDPDGFWSLVLDRLGIVFVDPPTAIRSTDDPENPGWLPGASYSIVANCLAGAPDETVIVHGTASNLQRLTRGELAVAVGRFAGGLVRHGFEPGDRIAIAMPLTTEVIVAYLGIIGAGCVVVSIADSFAPDEIAIRLGITNPAAVVTQDVTRREGRQLPMYGKCASASDIPCIVVDTGAGMTLRDQDMWFASLSDGADHLEPRAQSANAHTNILFSSGTTGEPKAIPWTQVTPIKASMDGHFHLDIHSGDVVAWPTNLGWMMGPWLIYASLLNGAAMALYDDAPTGRGFVEFVDAAAVTMLGLVPSIVSTWRAAGTLERGDWSTVRVLSSTGEASNADDYSWLMDVAGGVPMIEYCGGTEVGGSYITGTVLQPAFAGRFTTPALGLDLRILDGAGEDADEGEVFLVPPSMGLSTELLNRNHHNVYFSSVPASDVSLRRHGDQMERLPNGTFRARGRVDDVMNLGGIKTSAAEIEDVVVSVVGVGEAAAVGIPPEGGGPERLVVFAVVDVERTADDVRHEMQEAIRSHLNPLFRIHEVVIVESLPRTASHKVMRRTLRGGYQ